ncbi:hypothetical protein [Paenibacillus agri]|uniref:Cellobiose phosphorylase n=1 Tax=Paenibacillus agri TaxID=2744309 RepID=A0A850ERS2_9BACL|nr:hypothetical protein [Paenibacillus agri]NUU61452.1 hypothetical protein [Paenibacillus agri]
MEAYHNCLRCMNRRVRILTVDGQRHEGVIVNVDRNNVYLKSDGADRVQTSAFFGNPFAANDILVLSLFTLLAIALV